MLNQLSETEAKAWSEFCAGCGLFETVLRDVVPDFERQALLHLRDRHLEVLGPPTADASFPPKPGTTHLDHLRWQELLLEIFQRAATRLRHRLKDQLSIDDLEEIYLLQMRLCDTRDYLQEHLRTVSAHSEARPHIRVATITPVDDDQRRLVLPA